jgi:Protein of unknown function (DUF992)
VFQVGAPAGLKAHEFDTIAAEGAAAVFSKEGAAMSIGLMKSALVLALSPLVMTLAAGEASARVKLGVLTCQIAPGVGLVLGSSKGVSCDFSPTRMQPEHYVGRINKLGIDIGVTGGGAIVWVVFAAHSGYSRYALAGSYGGASAEASLVVGLGANALVGGSGRSFALQPFSVQGQTGVNLAVGVTSLVLNPAR